MEEVSNYIGKNIVYATKDTSGGGTTSFTSKGKVVDHNKKYDVITLDNGVRINTHLHHRKDNNLYHKGDFYIVNSAEDFEIGGVEISAMDIAKMPAAQQLAGKAAATVGAVGAGAAIANRVMGKSEKYVDENAEDRCKRKADSVYGKKTSAYKSGAMVRCRKGKIWKKK